VTAEATPRPGRFAGAGAWRTGAAATGPG
jgi:hypothetical protein